MPLQTKTLSDGRMMLSYFRFGKRGAQPIVILPGIALVSVMQYADAVAAAYQSLADDFDIYVLDKRSNVAMGYSLQEMAEDTAAALDMLGLHDVHLYGVSLGGMIAQYLAASRPDLVKSMALCSTVARLPQKAAMRFLEWFRLAQNRDLPALIRSFAESVYTDAYYQQNKAALFAMADQVTPEDLERFIIYDAVFPGLNAAGLLQNIRCPSLVLGAAHDALFGTEQIAEMAQALGGTYYIYPDYGHAVYDEAPDCLDRVGAFFRRET